MQKQIEEILKRCLEAKFASYKPETSNMPFHSRLLGKDRLALYSFIQSLNTTFGTSIFEPVAQALAAQRFREALLHQNAGNRISSAAQEVIQNIMDELSTAERTPDKMAEIKAIRAVCTEGQMRDVKLTQIDLKLVSTKGSIYLIDIKTAKPNIGGFKEFKRSLLEWAAAALADEPDADIHTLVAIPYNPYEPKPYNRWTIRGMLDLEYELKVGREFWDFLGGEGAYEMLLNAFENVGIELRPVIDEYFARFAERRD